MRGDLAQRLDRLESIDQIRRLVGRYALAMDSHDAQSVAAIFAENAVYRWDDDYARAEGRDAIVNLFNGRFARVGFHVTHDHLIDLDPVDPDLARGLVSGHAEVQRDDGQYVVATRYRDIYVRRNGVWLFGERVLQHLYFIPLGEYAGILGRTDRIRTRDGMRPGHWPKA